MKPYLYKNHMNRSVTILMLLFMAGGNASVFGAEGMGTVPAQKAYQSSSQAADTNYVLQPGDRVSIKIYPEDQYVKGGEMQISTDGIITLPLVGKVKVGGESIQDAEKAIAKIVDEDYLVNPEVVIEILSFKEQTVVILGQVKKPGTVQFPPGSTKLTLLQAISLAGGFSDIANMKKIKVIRNSAGDKQVIQADAEDIMGGHSPDIDLEPGDIVNVSESLF